MHEIRATVPPEYTPETARLAHEARIDRVSIADVYIHGPDERRQLVSVETSTPKARVFVDALLASTDYSLTSRELRAIVERTDLAELSKPMGEPFPDVIQDLWQLSHVTASLAALDERWRGDSPRHRHHRRQCGCDGRCGAFPAIPLGGSSYFLS